MVSEEHESFLPRVEAPDLLELVFDDATDPSHNNRWIEFCKTNPVLAREVLDRVGIAAQFRAEPILLAVERNKTAVDLASFVVATLDIAARREHQEQAVGLSSGDGVDGEVPPP